MSIVFGKEGKYPHRKKIQHHAENYISTELDIENNKVVIDTTLQDIEFDSDVKMYDEYAPTNNLHVATKGYVDQNIPSITVVQTIGTSTTSVMSQKAVTDELGAKQDALGFTPAKDLSSITKEYTGFSEPTSVVINGDSTTRKVTLYGSWTAYWRSSLVPALTNGYVSDAHGDDTSKTYYLYYNGSTIAWYDTIWSFDMLQITIAKYDSVSAKWYYLRECHGLAMDYKTHEEFHRQIGTYKVSGGTISNYTLDSTTSSNRRPDISELVIADEDLETTISALTSKLYSRFRLDGSGGSDYYVTNDSDIIALSTNNPYYNQYTGSTWQNTLMPANSVATVWIYAYQCANDSESQKRRLLFVAPQSITQAANSSTTAINNAVATESSKVPSDLNLGTIASQEIVCIGKIIIAYTSSNWVFKQVSYVSGSRSNQSNASGCSLLSVSTNATLSGNGTSSNPLKVNWLTNGVTDYTGATPSIIINDTENQLQYVTVSSGSTGDGTITHSSYPTSNRVKNVIIYNSRGTDFKIVFPTANVTSGGITYVFHKYVDNITVKNGFMAELNFIYNFTDSTNCQVIIVAQATTSKSS